MPTFCCEPLHLREVVHEGLSPSRLGATQGAVSGGQPAHRHTSHNTLGLPTPARSRTTSAFVPSSSPVLLSTALVSRSQTPTRRISPASSHWCHPARRGSAVPCLDRCPPALRGGALPLLRVFSGWLHASDLALWAYPSLRRVSGGKDSKNPPVLPAELHYRPIHHRITHSQMLPLRVASTCLSCASTPRFRGCQRF